jgi:RNA polymerase sigma factor (sigma-70 family)
MNFTEVVNEHWTAVYKLLHTLTGNVHDTEDLTQETFLKSLNRLHTFQTGTNLRAWLLRIATNTFFDLRRKRKRVNHERLPDEVPGAIVSPGHAMEVGEQGERLRKAMQELTETTRTVFHLRVTEELSFREIAQMLDTSEEAARWHMHQARTKLLGRLSDAEADAPATQARPPEGLRSP